MDEVLRAELLARREEDQRVRHLVTPPRGQYAIRLPDDVAADWQHVDDSNAAWLGGVVASWVARRWRDPVTTPGISYRTCR
jgi:hypothetical protein